MNPFGFLLGIVTFGAATKLKRPLRQAAVFTASQALNITDVVKTAAYSVKEEFEDIIAEAHYRHMKKNIVASQVNQFHESAHHEEEGSNGEV